MMVNHLNKDDVEQKIIMIVIDKITTVGKDQVVPCATLHQLGIDSLDLVEIVLEIEDSFNCLVDDAKIEELETITEIIDYVHAIARR